jgi:hypothetical protein
VGTIATAPAPVLDAAPAALGAAPTIGHYTERDTGAIREVAHLSLADGTALVVDRLSGTHGDPRLLARLAADEPAENARILCSMYLADGRRGRCRPVTGADFDVSPVPEVSDACLSRELRDDDGAIYRVQTVASDGRFPELRWTRSNPADPGERLKTVRLREVVARFEDYEPARITASALVARRANGALSTACLAGELRRLTESSIVLNRGLREAVQSRLARGHLTLSEIAIRCGRCKYDRRGNTSGETSWLARRIGQTPEAGRRKPTPWISSDVLALIAREGLGVAPREVEL